MFNLRDIIGKKRPDHPMYDVEAARKLLGDLSADPGEALAEVASWLDTVAATEGYDPDDRVGVIQLLDETGQRHERKVLTQFLRDEAVREHDRLKLWHALAEFWEHAAVAYELCLKETTQAGKPDEPRPERTRLALRALRARGNEAKILHLRYLPVPPAVWQALASVYSLCEQEKITAQAMKAYESDSLPTTARQEFLHELMFDTTGPESQKPLDVELTARVISRLAGGFVLQPAPGSGLNFCFDLAHPGRPPHVAPKMPASPTLRYFGVGRVHDAILEIVARHGASPDEPEKRFGDDYTVQDKLVLLKRLLVCWGDSPPHRRTQRVKIGAAMKVAHGFRAASHMVTRIEFGGMAEVTTNLNMKMKEQTGLTLEEEKASTVISEWTERDASTWGLGVDIPRQDESWAKIGALCVFQPAGLKVWWTGVIRRFYRDAQGRAHAGIEVLAKKPVSVYLRGIGEGSQRADNWASSSGSFQFTYVNALLLGETTADTRKEMIIARDAFAPGILYEAMIGEKTPHVKLEELLEHGDDYDRVRVTWLKESGHA